MTDIAKVREMSDKELADALLQAKQAHIGDTVRIEESRPLSATKRWRLVEIVQRAGDHGLPAELELIAEEPEVSEAIHAAAHPGRAAHEAEAEADAAAGDADQGA